MTRGERIERATAAAARELEAQGVGRGQARTRAEKLVASLEKRAGDQLGRFTMVGLVLDLPRDEIMPWLEAHGYAPVRSATTGGVTTNTRSGALH